MAQQDPGFDGHDTTGRPQTNGQPATESASGGAQEVRVAALPLDQASSPIAAPAVGERLEVAVVAPEQTVFPPVASLQGAELVGEEGGLPVVLPGGGEISLADFIAAAQADLPGAKEALGEIAPAAGQDAGGPDPAGAAHGGGASFTGFDPGPIGDPLAPADPLPPSALAGSAAKADTNGAPGTANGNPSTVTITANPVNDAPMATNDAYSVAEDTALDVAAAGVLANDGDADGDALSAILVSGASDGSVTLNADGSFSYTPNADFNGTDSFTYQANDGTANSNAATVTITVDPVNDPPVAQTDSTATTLDTPVTIDVLANDSDVDGDALSVTSVTQGSDGSVALNPDGTVAYTPNPGFTGTDSFGYVVSDGNGGSDAATVTISTVACGIEGGPGDDWLTGTAGDDVICGHGGDDRLDGRNGSDMLFGGSGDDRLNGQGGADKLFGGDGDDVLIWDPLDSVVDGGLGTDTLRVEGGNVDLTSYTGSLSGIERIDLSADPDLNALTLSAQDVFDISDTNALAVLGDSGDSVDAGTGWTDAGSDAAGNHVFTQMVAGVLTTLSVDPEISTNPDITA